MAFEDIKAKINLLLQQMQNQPEDEHELYEMLHEKLNEIRALNMPLPEDLSKLEQQLEEKFRFSSSADRR